jgi:hypothetical protein
LVLILTAHFWGVLAVLFVITGLIDLGLWRWKNFQDQRVVEDTSPKDELMSSIIRSDFSIRSNRPPGSIYDLSPPPNY